MAAGLRQIQSALGQAAVLGGLQNADVNCDGESFTATIEAAVDETRTVQVGRHTFHLSGKAIGLAIFRQVETLFEGRPWKKNTAFTGSLCPAEDDGVQ